CLLDMIKFLFVDYEEESLFLKDCMGKSNKDINKYVYEYRERKINELDINRVDFVNKYRNNRKEALEYLFQESLPLSWLKKLKLDNPVDIFEIHSKMDKTIFFMKFVRST
ncbi:hypothetical protein BSK50_30365, partial [Paenibacillus odorifer]